MKKFFAIAAMLLTLSPVMAQNVNEVDYFENNFSASVAETAQNSDVELCKNELSVSAGFMSLIQFADEFFSLADGKEDLNPFGICVDYSHRVSKKVLLGATANFYKGTFTHGDDSHTEYYTLMPHVKFEYLNKKYFTLYGKAGAGVIVNNYKDEDESGTRAGFAFQVSPLGLEVGPNEHFRAFGEVGVGCAGTAQIGLRYKF